MSFLGVWHNLSSSPFFAGSKDEILNCALVSGRLWTARGGGDGTWRVDDREGPPSVG